MTDGKRIRYISACAGVGGFDLAADRLGWECVGQIELADFPTRILARRFPNIPRHCDLKACRGTRGQGDVLMGGTPCQDWSVAGKRAGLAGERSGLFFEFARVADEVAPRVVVWENVPGVLSACSCGDCRAAGRILPGHGGGDFAVVLDELTGFWPEPPKDGWKSAGVCVGPKRTAVWRVLDSRYAGVAQRRRRVFLVASPRAECAIALLAEPDGRTGDLAAGREAGADVAGTLEGGDGSRGWRVGADEAGGHIQVVGHGPGPLVMTETGADRAVSEDISPTLRKAAHRAPTVMRMREGKDGGGKGPLLSEDASLTLARANDQTLFAPASVRRLTPTETERLQAFPDGWTCTEVDDDGTGTFRFPDGEPYSTERCTCPDGPRYAAMGDAVTVSVAFGVLAAINAELGGKEAEYIEGIKKWRAGMQLGLGLT